MELIFATNNDHKVLEVRDILRGGQVTHFEVKPMKDIGHTSDLPETHETIRENAIEKADYLFRHYGASCFSEDSGLEIDALDGKPGVHTAHYSGSRDAAQNIALVLQQMGDTPHRTARFRTVIALILRGATKIAERYVFEGVCEGTIRLVASGTGGFGYDPIFEPETYDQTFAELPMAVKSQISHRAKAMAQMIAFLKTY
jgi:XTP/dITP diphosphohydrolase